MGLICDRHGLLVDGEKAGEVHGALGVGLAGAAGLQHIHAYTHVHINTYIHTHTRI